MAENNEFFREVDEDYRRDRFIQIWKRYNALIIAGAILLVAGVGGWNYWRHAELVRAEATSARFDTANRLAKDGKTAEAERDFAAIQADGPAGYALLARFRNAAETGKRDAAAGGRRLRCPRRRQGRGRCPARPRPPARRPVAARRIGGGCRALSQLQGMASPTGTFRHTAREMLGLTACARAISRAPAAGSTRSRATTTRPRACASASRSTPPSSRAGGHGHRGQARERRAAPADHPLTPSAIARAERSGRATIPERGDAAIGFASLGRCSLAPECPILTKTRASPRPRPET